VSTAAAARSRTVLGFVAGLVFGAGLLAGGMTLPRNVLAFLDVSGLADGRWDGRLALVMGGAIGVFLPVWRLAKRRGEALLGGPLAVPPEAAIDARLIGGAAIFGVGWGLGGYCPGSALVSLGAGLFDPATLAAAGAFVASMVLGQRLAAATEPRGEEGTAQPPAETSACAPDAPETAA
jgi:uncharacterized membrane protein YedE/YeeE